MKTILFYVSLLLLVIAMGIGGWYLKRYWNYKWSYEAQVNNTVCKMVNPEHLSEYGKRVCD